MAEPEGAEPAPLPESVEDALASLHEKGKLPTETDIDRWCSAHPDAAQRIRGAIAALRELTPPERPEHVGPWRIRSTLGEGGMGTVYLAERTEPVHMRAALKLIKLGMDSRAVLARFEQERQALARMQHDGIAKVYDCGTSERGQPYFAMELVEGRPLTTFCDANQVGLRQRLRLMRSVCDAVQHAHNKGVVHRDLKPSNVLVSGDADAPRIKVIDFGLAKALGEKLVAATLFTEAGQLIGTPEYMAPEQADPLNTDIDTRADVYSLGVMLYELLVGELPFSTKEVRGANPTAMRRMLLDKDAPRPSTRLRARSTAKRDTLPILRALRSDLDWVVLKALEKDPERRYETPDALAEDLRRFLDHEPLIAGPPSASYRIKKLLRRHRLAFAAAGAVLTTAISGAVVAIDFAIEAKAQATIAQQRSSDFDLLSAVLHQERALEHKNQLYPATPSKLPQMRRWLAEECDPLLAMRGTIAATVDKLAASRLEPTASAGSTEFLESALRTLLPKLDALSDLERPQVEQLVRWADYLAEIQGRDHADAPATWQQCRLAIAAADDVVASARYRGVAIDFDNEAFLGLVPLGINPATKLLEFYDLRSAWDGASDPRTIAIPRLATDGSIRVEPETGIVFVLLPGGHVELGAQSTDKNAPRYENTEALLTPPYRVRLAPFLVARHELTRAQWKRLWTWDNREAEPSYFIGDGRAAGKRMLPTNPVDHMNWHMADSIVRRNAMSLPTVAQWEYAARGGTDTPWWCGTSQEDLQGKANLCDKTGKRYFAYWGHSVPFDDEYVFHAVVGTFAANPFGLHDAHGNVKEWCIDAVDGNPEVRDGDGRRGGGTDRGNAGVCGGDFGSPADHARAAMLNSFMKDIRTGETGLRPVRLLHPQ